MKLVSDDYICILTIVDFSANLNTCTQKAS